MSEKMQTVEAKRIHAGEKLGPHVLESYVTEVTSDTRYMPDEQKEYRRVYRSNAKYRRKFEEEAKDSHKNGTNWRWQAIYPGDQPAKGQRIGSVLLCDVPATEGVTKTEIEKPKARTRTRE